MPLDPKLLEDVEKVFTDRPDLLDTFLKDLGPIETDPNRPNALRKARIEENQP